MRQALAIFAVERKPGWFPWGLCAKQVDDRLSLFEGSNCLKCNHVIVLALYSLHAGTLKQSQTLHLVSMASRSVKLSCACKLADQLKQLLAGLICIEGLPNFKAPTFLTSQNCPVCVKKVATPVASSYGSPQTAQRLQLQHSFRRTPSHQQEQLQMARWKMPPEA